MLSKRSFKSPKCKTSLKLAGSRAKLMRNKKEGEVKQMKMDVAKLLESGQDRTAMIQVQHIVTEENKLSAYDLIEIYCELIVARLAVIELQKNCPIDLKEAITSVIFAAPRCADIPELMDALKHFTAKYGKDFISAAVELRPNCGVARLMIEKLSLKPPDGPSKIKILKLIAQEHNIKWDPAADNNHEDNLNGPRTFGNDRQMYSDLPNVPIQGRSAFQVQSSQDRRSVDYTQNNGPTQNVHTRVPTCGSENERMDFVHSNYGNGWNMEFKDVATAAQEAAECADRASLAARAAATLSSRENSTIQYSSGSTNSPRGDHPKMYYATRVERAKDQENKAQMKQNDGSNQNNNLTGGVNQRSYNHGVNKSSQSSFNNERKSSGAGRRDPTSGLSFSKPSTKSHNIGKQVSNTTYSHATPKQTSFNDKPSTTSDEFSSDDDVNVVDEAHKLKERESTMLFSSPRHDMSHRLSTKSSTTAPRLDDMVSVTFYDSEGPNYESEEEDFGFRNFASKLKTSLDLDDDSTDFLNDQMVEGNLGRGLQQVRPSGIHKEVKASEVARTMRNKESSSRLNLEMLTGGLRNKGYRKPPYTYNQPGNVVLSKQTIDDDTCNSRRINEAHTSTKVNGKPCTKPSSVESDHDSDEEFPRNNKSMHMNVNVKLSPRSKSSTAYFDSDTDDLKVNLLKQTSTSKAISGTKFSQRTKTTVFGEVTPRRNVERSRTSSELHDEFEKDLEWTTQVSETSLKSAAREVLPSKSHPNPTTKIGSLRSLNSSAPHEKKLAFDCSLKEVVQPGSPKPSFVHPKLPDIDSLTAHFQSLRSIHRRT